MHIPICDPKQEYLTHKTEMDAAIHCVLEAGHYILGPNVAAFEKEIASYLGGKHAVGVNSGTDALHLALRALDIGPGDEVITTPFTFVATTEAIGMVGATPVFADIDLRTFNIDPNCIAEAITPRTKAVLPVHLFGQPCDMDAIMEIADHNDLFVIEDCAQAIGASYRGRMVGTLGTIGCFSFFPTKNLNCFGDGGMVVTNDAGLHQRVETLRRHGAKVKYHHSQLGLNSRLDELQAAILRIKLRHLDHRNRLRRRCADRYRELIARASTIRLPNAAVPQPNRERTRIWYAPVGRSRNMRAPSAHIPMLDSSERDSSMHIESNLPGETDLIEPVYHQYTVLLEDRDSVRSTLTDAGIGSAVYYPVPLHLQEVHRVLNLREGAFPNAEYVSKNCLSLPMYPKLKAVEQAYIAEKICAAVDSYRICKGNKMAG